MPGGTNVANLDRAALLANERSGVAQQGSQSYGPLVVGRHSASEPFSFTAHGTNQAHRSVRRLHWYDGTKSIGTNLFSFTLGTWVTSFTNGSSIAINDNTYASPYPATINVSGVGGALIQGDGNDYQHESYVREGHRYFARLAEPERHVAHGARRRRLPAQHGHVDL